MSVSFDVLCFVLGKDLVKEVICLYGDDNPYIPQDKFHNLAESINAREIIIKNGGHLNKEAGFNSFNEIIELI